AKALLGQSSRTPVWRSTRSRSSESSCSRMVPPTINLCINPSPCEGLRSQRRKISVVQRGGGANFKFYVLIPRSYRCEGLAGILFRLQGSDVHFLFQRRKSLQHFVNSQSHVANGFNLRACRRRQAPGFEQQ